MGAPDVLAHLADAGIRVKSLPDGRLWAEPADLLTDDLRELIRKHRAELLAALRRRKVLAMLDAHPGTKYALTADETDCEAVTVALAIRGQATVEFRIAYEKYDPFQLLNLLEQHGGTLQ